ncbi:MAG: pyruvate kinase, partial [Nitrosomonas sp.]|nr:pyruvate kinase [Nitrosomonas sp.]
NGDLIIMTIGEPVGKAGGTNTMKIIKVGSTTKSAPTGREGMIQQSFSNPHNL